MNATAAPAHDHPTTPPAPTGGAASAPPDRRAGRPRWWQGALAGVVSGAAGLAVAEVVVGVFDTFTSPVISVGNKAVDLVPVPVKTFAIRTFGTHDKTALLAGIATAIVIFAALVGMAGTRRRAAGVVGLVAFGFVGAAAAVTGRTGRAIDAVPSLIAALVGSASLVALLSLAVRTAVPTATVGDPTGTPATSGGTTTATTMATTTAAATTTPPANAPVARRAFLLGTAGLAGTTALAGGIGRALQSSATAVASRARSLVARAKVPLPPPAAGITAPALADVTPFFTPNKDFYRIDTALVVPKIDARTWKLKVRGMVEHERTYTYDQLLARDLVERDITLTCVSNEVGGILMGTARWVGVPLRELLEEAGANPKATQVVGRSVDGWTSGFPTSTVLDGREPIVALAMNGEALPFRHGFPARLIVPGLYGYVSATKWLTEIEMTTLDAFDAYWVPRGYSKQAPIKLASRIDVPRGLATVPAGPAAIAGVAWSQTVGISRVELSIDGGPWFDAKLADAPTKDTWRQWSHTWEATSGRHEIAVRATDADGRLQREARSAPLPNGATGWHSIIVFVA